MILIVDTEYKGHHSEYLDILISQLINNKKESYFLINPEFLNQRPYLKNIDFIHFFEWKPSGSFIGIVKEVRNIINLAKKKKISNCILLNFNRYFKVLPFLKICRFKFSGIYYMPFLNKSNISKSEKIIKTIFFKIILSKKCISKIYLLNDKKSVSHYNSYFNTNKFSYLTDPVFNKQSIKKEKFKMAAHYPINFTFIGEISSRKGIYVLLDTINLLSDQTLQRISFTIAGNTPFDKDEIRSKIEHLSDNKKVNFKDLFFERIDDSIFEKLMYESDYILALHQMLEGSSGILGKAALFSKFILGPEKGLIGRTIRKYSLGVQVDTSNPANIADAIEKMTMTYLTIPKKERKKFLEDHNPEHFYKTIISL